jgi:hypothetical protein
MAAKNVTKADLDEMGCGVVGCGHDHSILYLIPGCHPTAGTSCRYEKRPGRLVISCKRCGKEVVRICLTSEIADSSAAW